MQRLFTLLFTSRHHCSCTCITPSFCYLYSWSCLCVCGLCIECDHIFHLTGECHWTCHQHNMDSLVVQCVYYLLQRQHVPAAVSLWCVPCLMGHRAQLTLGHTSWVYKDKCDECKIEVSLFLSSSKFNVWAEKYYIWHLAEFKFLIGRKRESGDIDWWSEQRCLEEMLWLTSWSK